MLHHRILLTLLISLTIGCEDTQKTTTNEHSQLYKAPRLFIHKLGTQTGGCKTILTFPEDPLQIHTTSCGEEGLALQVSCQYLQSTQLYDLWAITVAENRTTGSDQWSTVTEKTVKFNTSTIEIYRNEKWRVLLDAGDLD